MQPRQRLGNEQDTCAGGHEFDCIAGGFRAVLDGGAGVTSIRGVLATLGRRYSASRTTHTLTQLGRRYSASRTTHTLSRSVEAGDRLVERPQELLVGEVGQGQLVTRGEHVILGDHDDGGLLVELDRVVRTGVAVAQASGRRVIATCTSPCLMASAHSATSRATSSSETSGCRSSQMRTHLLGVTPGTYARRNVEARKSPARSGVVTTKATARYPGGDELAVDETGNRRQEAGRVPAGNPPAEFRDGSITRAELAALQADPPEWLKTLRAEGPHPKNLVAAKLGVSNSALVRNGITEALTTAQINELLAEMPEWLVAERATQVEVRREERRVKSLHEDRRRDREESETAEDSDS